MASKAAFGFSISPPENSQVTAQDEYQVLVLSPSTSHTCKITFQNIEINREAKRNLIIRNSTESNVKVDLWELPPEEHHLHFSTTKIELGRGGETFLEVSWVPQEAGSWQFFVQVRTSSKSKADFIPIICSSVDPNSAKSREKPLTPRGCGGASVLAKKVITPKASRKAGTVVTSKKLLRKAPSDAAPSPENKENRAPLNLLPVASSFPASPKAATECHVDDGFVAQWRSPLQSIKEDGQAMRQVTLLQVPEPYVLRTSPNAPTKSIKEVKQDSREASLDPPVDLLQIVKPVVLHISPPSAPPGQQRLSKVSPALKKELSKLSKTVGTMNVRQSADSCSTNPTGSTRLQPSAVLGHGSVHKLKKFHPSLPMGSASNAQLRRSSFKGIPSTSLKLSGTVPRVSQKVAKRQQEKSEFLFNPDGIIAEMVNKETFVQTAASDPFLSRSVYYDGAWKARQEKKMIKWLNALLTPPAELTTDDNMPAIDLADLWQQTCKKKQVGCAPSRDKVSSDLYQAPARLQSLRQAAIEFFRSDEIKEVLSKVSVHVDKKLIMIREDRDLHIDMGLKQIVLELLLCYNPLWLRIALEVVYGRTVRLDSNSDVVGLATFIVNNVLTDQHIVATYSHPTVPHLMLPGFQDAMKKFTLRKFLFIVYFLDKAKTSKMIRYDPCLFMRQAKFKDSRDIILAFSRELLGGGSDIIRHLAVLGYNLSVKQQYLDEFEYAVKSLLDLRDGVRLTRVMELITENGSLSAKLRVPAISRLQKIHNVDVALRALCSAGYSICGDIQAKDLAEGHREKTLSFLWQIIYEFQAPLFTNAAVRIQVWWHKLRLSGEIRRRIKERKRAKHDAAAIKIQAFWRAYCARLHVAILRKEQAKIRAAREHAAIVVQKHYRRHLAQKELAGARSAAVVIQRLWKGTLLMRKQRAEYLRMYSSVIFVQQKWRALSAMKLQRSDYMKTCSSVIKIQQQWRAYSAMKEERSNFICLRKAAVTIQSWWLSQSEVKKEQAAFRRLRLATVVIQRHWRAQLAMRRDRCAFTLQVQSAVFIQRHVRGFLARLHVQRFRQQAKRRKQMQRRNEAVTKIQSLWRGYSVRLKQSSEIIASKDRVAKAVKNSRNEPTLEAQWQKVCQGGLHVSSDVGKVIAPLKSLDTITKLSPILCSRCVESGFLQTLIDFLCRCNQSLVHQESCAIITSILLTLVKFELTTDSVWQEGKVLYLIMHQMKVWIGKDDKIFLNCATILYHFASSGKEQVILREPGMKQTLEGFATKLKNKSTTKKPKYLPALKNTWGVKLNNPRPRRFDDPVYAVRCITSKLKITLN